jgi:hypothetical protein
MSKKKKEKKSVMPKVNPELKGLDIYIDAFGEVKTNFDIDRINAFLDKNVVDKKLVNRDENSKS